MATIVWAGGSGNWNAKANWVGKVAPAATDTAQFNAGAYTVNVNGNEFVDAVVAGPGVVLSLKGGHSLTTTGSITLNGATVEGVGSKNNPATVDAQSGFAGSGTLEAGSSTGGGTLLVLGTVGPSVHLAISSAGTSNLILASSNTIATNQISLSSVRQTLTLESTLTITGTESISTGNIVLAGGTWKDLFGTTLGGGTTLSGDGTVNGAFDSAGTVTASGGVLLFTNAVDASGALTTFNIGKAATLAFNGAVGPSAFDATRAPLVDFSGKGATLNLTGEGASNNFNGAIEGFGKGDQIDVASSGNPGDYLVFDANQSLLTVKSAAGATLESIHFAETPQGFNLTESGGVDTITICFLAGTRIRTPEGEVPVEALKPGDLVATADGRAIPVCWLGRQTISMRFADPARVLPIRIKAGALDDNVPSRDLLLSPDHALLIDGALIPAGAIVNGTSIVREPHMPAVFTYYHVETEDHSLILAENAPAETFVDSVDRLNFDNWAEYKALYPDGKTVEELPYPRAKTNRQVPVRVRVKLAERSFVAAPAASEVA